MNRGCSDSFSTLRRGVCRGLSWGSAAFVRVVGKPDWSGGLGHDVAEVVVCGDGCDVAAVRGQDLEFGGVDAVVLVGGVSLVGVFGVEGG